VCIHQLVVGNEAVVEMPQHNSLPRLAKTKESEDNDTSRYRRLERRWKEGVLVSIVVDHLSAFSIPSLSHTMQGAMLIIIPVC
jgi:hypothetical protein